jgi:hypothetical protein
MKNTIQTAIPVTEFGSAIQRTGDYEQTFTENTDSYVVRIRCLCALKMFHSAGEITEQIFALYEGKESSGTDSHSCLNSQLANLIQN